MGRFINADALVSTGQGILGNNMFAYCLNNPVVLVDTSGTAAHIGFSADGQLHDSPWKIGSPGGGGWPQDIHYSRQDYGSVADKFYTVRTARFVGNRIAHSATKWWGAYVCFVERTSDFCLQRNISMYHIGHDLISSFDRLEDFHGIIAGGVGASRLLANVAVGAPLIIYGEIVCPPVVGAALAVGAVVVSIVKIVKYFRSIPIWEE